MKISFLTEFTLILFIFIVSRFLTCIMFPDTFGNEKKSSISQFLNNYAFWKRKFFDAFPDIAFAW